MIFKDFIYPATVMLGLFVWGSSDAYADIHLKTADSTLLFRKLATDSLKIYRCPHDQKAETCTKAIPPVTIDNASALTLQNPILAMPGWCLS